METTGVQELLRHKTVGYWDFGTVTMVRPTGRYVSKHLITLVEIKTGILGGRKWVSSSCLCVVQTTKEGER